jgi:hypothetical protein
MRTNLEYCYMLNAKGFKEARKIMNALIGRPKEGWNNGCVRGFIYHTVKPETHFEGTTGFCVPFFAAKDRYSHTFRLSDDCFNFQQAC